MKRILITGGSSYLGQHLVPLASEQFEIRYTFFKNNPLNLPTGYQLNICDNPAVQKFIKSWLPDAIIHLAGSNRSAEMEDVIVKGTAHITEAAIKTGARLIHMSTDVVFDGRNPPYKETDPPNPIHPYGRAKSKAEDIVAQYADHVIVRTSLIYGLAIMDRSTEWITAALHNGRPVILFNDQLRNPVWAPTLSRACLELAPMDFRGILHIAGQQVQSRAEFGLKLLDWWEVKNRENLSVGPSDAAGPPDCRLDLSLAKSLLSTPLPGVDEVLNQRGSDQQHKPTN